MYTDDDLLKAFTLWIEAERSGNCSSKDEANELPVDELAQDHLQAIKFFHQQSKAAA